MRTARHRRLFKEYLATGRMLEPIEVGSVAESATGSSSVALSEPVATSPMPTFGDLGIPFAFIPRTPTVMASAWAAGPDAHDDEKNGNRPGSVGIVLASLEPLPTPTQQTFSTPAFRTVYVPINQEELMRFVGSSTALVDRVNDDGTRTPLNNGRPVNFRRPESSGILAQIGREEIVLIEFTPTGDGQNRVP